MSMNSSSSISSSQRRECRHSRVLTSHGKQRAILDYEPAVFCKCGLKAPRWISWTDNHTGQRFYKCARVDDYGDCGFFQWVDGPVTGWVRQVIMELRDCEKELADRNVVLEAEVARVTLENRGRRGDISIGSETETQVMLDEVRCVKEVVNQVYNVVKMICICLVCLGCIIFWFIICR